MADVDIGFAPGGGGSGLALTPGAYAAGLSLQNVNAASVALAWYLADSRGDMVNFIDLISFGEAQITSTTLAALVASADDMAAVAASEAAFAAVLASEAAFAAVLASETAFAAVLASETAFAAVLASETAFAAVLASETAFAAVLASEAAFAAVLASETAFAAVLASQAARYQIWLSDVAITAIFNNSAAHDAARAAGTLHSKSANDTTDVSLTTGVTGGNLDPNGKYLVLGVSWANTADRTITLKTARSDTTRPTSGPWLGAQASGNDATAGFDIAAPIEETLAFALTSFGNITTYFRVLDCTPPA